MLVLVVGDLHIPYRAPAIPDTFKSMFVPGRIQYIIVTGNITNAETAEYLKSICSNILFVHGDQDEFQAGWPEFSTVQLEGLKFGVVHGHQVVPWGDKEVLGMWQRRLDCDVLVSGHTHSLKHFEQDGKLFVNPGSLTGATSSVEADPTPSFILMDIQGANATSFMYSLDSKEEQGYKVKKKLFTKE